MTRQRTIIHKLESIVDTYSLREVLDALAEMCREKAQHVTENWQDTTLAETWGSAADEVQSAADNVPQGM